MPPQVPSPPQPPSSGQQDPLQRRHCRWRRQGKGPAKGPCPVTTCSSQVCTLTSQPPRADWPCKLQRMHETRQGQPASWVAGWGADGRRVGGSCDLLGAEELHLRAGDLQGGTPSCAFVFEGAIAQVSQGDAQAAAERRGAARKRTAVCATRGSRAVAACLLHAAAAEARLRRRHRCTLRRWRRTLLIGITRRQRPVTVPRPHAHCSTQMALSTPVHQLPCNRHPLPSSSSPPHQLWAPGAGSMTHYPVQLATSLQSSQGLCRVRAWPSLSSLCAQVPSHTTVNCLSLPHATDGKNAYMPSYSCLPASFLMHSSYTCRTRLNLSRQACHTSAILCLARKDWPAFPAIRCYFRVWIPSGCPEIFSKICST